MRWNGANQNPFHVLNALHLFFSVSSPFYSSNHHTLEHAVCLLDSAERHSTLLSKQLSIDMLDLHVNSHNKISDKNKIKKQTKKLDKPFIIKDKKRNEQRAPSTLISKENEMKENYSK